MRIPIFGLIKRDNYFGTLGHNGIDGGTVIVAYEHNMLHSIDGRRAPFPDGWFPNYLHVCIDQYKLSKLVALCLDIDYEE